MLCSSSANMPRYSYHTTSISMANFWSGISTSDGDSMLHGRDSEGHNVMSAISAATLQTVFDEHSMNSYKSFPPFLYKDLHSLVRASPK